MVVYLDGIMGLNFLVDLLLLLGVNRLSGFPPGVGRATLGAAVGGGYAGLCLVPGFRFLGSVLWRVASLGVMSMAAFGMSRSAIRRGLLFVILSMALGGLAVSFNAGQFWGLTCCAAVLSLLCTFCFSSNGGKHRILNATLSHGDRTVRLQVLRDTGNTLRDPVTGEPVLIADSSVGEQLVGIHREWFHDPVAAVEAHPGLGLRLIPYRAVGINGFLLGLRCDSIRVGNQDGGHMVAFSPDGFTKGEYQGLSGGQYE